MKRIIIVVFILISYTTFGQDTPYVKPVTFTPMASNYWYKQQVKIDSVLQARKAIFRDSTGFQGVTTVPTISFSDSSRKAINSEWAKKYIRDSIAPGIPGQPTAAWSTTGNYSPVDPTPFRLGFKDQIPLHFITDDTIRLSIPATGINRRTNTVDKYLVMDTTTKELYYTDGGSGGGGSGITSLGSGWGLNNVNDSTYEVDSTEVASLTALADTAAAHSNRIDDKYQKIESNNDSTILRAIKPNGDTTFINFIGLVGGGSTDSAYNYQFERNIDSITGSPIDGNDRYFIFRDTAKQNWNSLLVKGGVSGQVTFRVYQRSGDTLTEVVARRATATLTADVVSRISINIYKGEYLGVGGYNDVGFASYATGTNPYYSFYYYTSASNVTTFRVSEASFVYNASIGIQLNTNFSTSTLIQNLQPYNKDTLNLSNFQIAQATNTYKRYDGVSIHNSTDGLIAVMHRFNNIISDYAQCSIVVYRSRDEGQNWFLDNVKPFWDNGATRTPYSEIHPDIIKRKDGSFSVFYYQNQVGDTLNRALIQVTLSEDGTAWSNHILKYDDTANVRSGGTGGVRFSNGDIYWAFYKLDSVGLSSTTLKAKTMVLKSIDDGITFTDTGVLFPDTGDSVTTFEPGIYELPNGNICVWYRTLTSFVRARISSDGGATYGNAFNLFRGANSMTSIRRIPGLGYDLKPKNIYYAVANQIVGANSTHEVNRRRLALYKSIDGLNFEFVQLLNNNANGEGVFEPNIRFYGNYMYVGWSVYSTNLISSYLSKIFLNEN